MKAERQRAGFWRRAFSFCIDGIVIFLPFQIIAAILFALTAGAVQFNNGITTSTCYRVTGIPNGLKPPPPANATSASLCKTFFAGIETARQLTVTRTTKDGNVNYSVSESYMIGRDDNQIDGWSLDWFAYAALLAYLIWAKLRKGGSLGDRAAKISVMDDSLKTGLPPPIKQMSIRYAALIGPALVTAAIVFALSKIIGGSAEDMAKYHYLAIGLALTAPALIYYFICTVQIVRKLDPYWDRLAMTAVLKRTPKPA